MGQLVEEVLLLIKMVEKRQKIRNKTNTEGWRAIFLMVVVCSILLIIPFVSSWEFDNIKHYDAELKEITLENAFGLGNDVAKIKLTSPLNFQVPRGYHKVAEFDLTYYMDDNGGLDLIEFYNIKNSMSKLPF